MHVNNPKTLTLTYLVTDHGQDHGQHTERKTTLLAWTCSPCGPLAHTTTSTVLAGTRKQGRARN